MPKDTKYYVIAVSGGVDSIVLLDALMTGRSVGGVDVWSGSEKGDVIVAHFDHGIRSDSREDALFVEHLAKRYGARFETRREELGPDASEEKARMHRYAFLREVCRQNGALLVTAHHANDVAESIAINITRGTGWRGVAVMDTESISRPFLGVLKREIVAYARKNNLEWREDSTNSTDAYLRNRLRKKMTDEDVTWQLAALRTRQIEIKRQIDDEALRLIGRAPYPRYFLTHCGDDVAVELLRALFKQETDQSPTRIVCRRVLHAVKTARAGNIHHVAAGVSLRFTRTHFVVENRV